MRMMNNMENKVLVKLIIPELEISLDAYLPISKRIGNIIALLIKAINELGYSFENNKSIALYNRITSEIYSPNDLVYKTNIRNGTILVLL